MMQMLLGWSIPAFGARSGYSDQFLRFYLGKKVAFVYRAAREVRGSKIRVIWGKVTRPHGTELEHRCSSRRGRSR